MFLLILLSIDEERGIGDLIMIVYCIIYQFNVFNYNLKINGAKEFRSR